MKTRRKYTEETNRRRHGHRAGQDFRTAFERRLYAGKSVHPYRARPGSRFARLWRSFAIPGHTRPYHLEAM